MLRDKLFASLSAPTVFNGVIGLSSGVNSASYSCASNTNYLVMTGTTGSTPAKAFIALFDRNGNLQWQRFLSDTVAVVGYSTKIDSSNNVYVFVGVFTTPTSAVLLKYNSSGTLQWQRKISDTSALNFEFQVASNWLQLGSDGSPYVAITRAATFNEAHVLKYNASGTLQWQRKYAASANCSTRGFALDSSDNPYITFGYGSIANLNLHIRKLNSSGTELIVEDFTNANWSSLYSGSITCVGTDVYLARSAGSADATLHKFNSSLTYQGSRTISGTSYGFSNIGTTGSSIVLVRSDSTGYSLSNTTPDITANRTVSSSLGANTGVFSAAKDSSKLVLSGRARLTSASYLDAMLVCTDNSNDTGSYTPVTIASDTLTDTSDSDRSNTATTPVVATATLTDATATLTDAAGNMTATKYPKV